MCSVEKNSVSIASALDGCSAIAVSFPACEDKHPGHPNTGGETSVFLIASMCYPLSCMPRPPRGRRHHTARGPVVVASPPHTAHTDATGGGPLPPRAVTGLLGLDHPHPHIGRVGFQGPLLHHWPTNPRLPCCVQHKCKPLLIATSTWKPSIVS